MKTDFPNHPLPFPDTNLATTELAHLGGPSSIPKEYRRTIFPVTTKEDILQMMVSMNLNPEDVLEQFKEDYRKYIGAPYAIVTSSGTSSLHLALIGAGVQPGDEVIVPAFTFIATAQAVVAAKCIPIFVDIDPVTYCMDPLAASKAITSKTKALMPVHVHGLPANINALREICDIHNLKLVEDASHAHSAKYHGRVCGSLGDSAGQSLMADKNFPVGGEGGIALFQTEEAYLRAKVFLEESGIDYDMSWIAAAFGIAQLRRLPYYDAIRARNADFLAQALKQTNIFTAPHVPEGLVHAYNMYRIQIHPEAKGLGDLPDYKIKKAISELLLAEGVPAREWQNKPIPGHLPFQHRDGFGKGYPFSLSSRKDFGYDIKKFPNVLKMLTSTLVLCRELRSPIEFERIQRYALAFQKVASRPDLIRQMALESDAIPTYLRDARLG